MNRLPSRGEKTKRNQPHTTDWPLQVETPAPQIITPEIVDFSASAA
jgi:hypothetical protein